MIEYRITTNGLRFRIEEKCYSFWGRKEYWSPVTGYGQLGAIWYDTFEEAHQDFLELTSTTWSPVASPPKSTCEECGNDYAKGYCPHGK